MERPNKVILLGNTGRDPCIQYLPARAGSMVLGFSLGDCDEVVAANSITMRTIRDFVKNCVASKKQPVVHKFASLLFCISKSLGFFGFTKVNLRNAP